MVLRWRFVILLFSLSLSLPARAAEEQSEALARQVCSKVAELRGHVTFRSRIRELFKLFLVKTLPGDLISAEITEGSRLEPPQPGMGSQLDGEAVIFSFEPPSSLKQRPEYTEGLARLAVLRSELRALRGPLRRIVSARSTEQCLERARRAEFDFSLLSRLAAERSRWAWVELSQAAERSAEEVADALSGLDLPWKLVRVTRLSQVLRRLRSGRVRHVVLVSHAQENGKLVDSAFDEYPSSFFETLSPHLRTLAIYSCHGRAVRSAYQLDARFLVVTAGGLRLQGVTGAVPVDAFKNWLRVVDQRASELDQRGRDPVTPSPEEPSCAFRLSGARPARGAVAVFLNQHLVGILDETSTDSEFPYPCSWEDRAANIVIVRGLGVFESARFPGASLVMERVSGSNSTQVELTHFLRADGSWQSSLARYR